MKYVAYGSNMSVAQMAHRAPDAHIIGTGHIVGARLEFYIHATIEYTGNPHDVVPVAVWEISPADKTRLDRYEGYPSYYVRHIVSVHMEDGSQIKGMVYTMTSCYPAMPSVSYYLGIYDAYKNLGLGSEIETVLVPALARSKRRMHDAV